MLDKMSLLPSQCRAARALLNWSRGELSKRCNVSLATLAEFEAGKREPYQRTLADVRAALEAAGVEFIERNGGGPGVRLRETEQPALTIPIEDLNAENDE